MPVGTAFSSALARERDHLLGQRGGGEVDLAHRQPEQRVAHRAADRARLDAGAFSAANTRFVSLAVAATRHP